MEQYFALKSIIAAIVYSGLGILILIFSCLVFDWLTPGDLWKDIVVEKNLPMAIVLAAMAMAVGQIVAAAIHG